VLLLLLLLTHLRVTNATDISDRNECRLLQKLMLSSSHKANDNSR